jgi:hypothetical protein
MGCCASMLVSHRLDKDQKLAPGEFRLSKNQKYKLTHQKDGNVVVSVAQPLWSTQTAFKSTSHLTLENDGNLVLYDKNGKDKVWESKTAGSGGDFFYVGSDGNCCITDSGGAGEGDNKNVWETKTKTPNEDRALEAGSNSTHRLNKGQQLKVGESLVSKNGKFVLVHEDNGMVNLYRHIWSTGTEGRKTRDFIMQNDGNVVLYGTDGGAIWATNTNGKGGDFLYIGADGNLVLSDSKGEGKADNVTIWESGTKQPAEDKK